MLYAFSDEQEELRSVLRRLLEDRSAARAVYDDDVEVPDSELWASLAGIGAAGLGVPAEAGGSGGGLLEQVVVAEELGRVVAPVPFVGTAVAGTAIAGMSRLESLLGRLVDGSATAGLALTTPLAPAVDGALTGVAPTAFDAAGAQVLIVTDGTSAYAVTDPTVHPQPSVDLTHPLSRVELYGCPAVRLEVPVEHLLAHARVLCAAEAVGVAATVLDMTTGYTVQRLQFGRPIGTFQAVKHRLSDMLVDVECARSAAYAGAWSLHAGGEPAPAVAMANAVATEAAVRVVSVAIQLHGGIGVTWEHDLHLFLRRAKSLESLFGSPTTQLAGIADTLLGPLGAVAP